VSRSGIASLAEEARGVLAIWPAVFGNGRPETEPSLRSSLALFFQHLVQQPAQAGGARVAQLRIGAAGLN